MTFYRKIDMLVDVWIMGKRKKQFIDGLVVKKLKGKTAEECMMLYLGC